MNPNENKNINRNENVKNKKSKHSVRHPLSAILLSALMVLFCAFVPYVEASAIQNRADKIQASSQALLSTANALSPSLKAGTNSESGKDEASIKNTDQASEKPETPEAESSTEPGSKNPAESSTDESAKAPTKESSEAPEEDPTKDSSKDPEKDPTKDSSKTPEKDPTKESSKAPEKDPTKESSKAPEKDPTKDSSRTPEKDPTKDSSENPEKNPPAEELTTSLSKVIQNTQTYILSVDTNPGWESQWYVLGNARNGRSLSDKYFHTFYKNAAQHIIDKEGILSASQYSEYSKSILSLTSIGYDARDIAGYNLLSYLADFTKVKKQGFNGPVWALMALNSHPSYSIPTVDGVEQQTTESLLIDYILGREVSGGGWTFSGNKADIDMTAITMQALAPYYRKSGYGNVTSAIDRALKVLSDSQSSTTGGFQSMSTENSESCAQVIVALSSLGIDCKTDKRFVKNGKWPVQALIDYKLNNSGFQHIKNGKVNSLATSQAFYALVAYQRLQNKKTSLYNMSDIQLTPGPRPDQMSASDPTTEADKDKDKDKNKNDKNDKDKNKGDKDSTDNQDKDKDKDKDKTKETTKAPAKPGKKPSKGGGSLNITNTTAAGTTQASTTKAANSTGSEEATSALGETESMDLTEESMDGGWSFLGEDYVPEASAEDYVDEENLTQIGGVDAAGPDTVTATASASTPRSLITGFISGFIGAGLAIFLYNYIKKRKKR